jgi:hypothetical protein
MSFNLREKLYAAGHSAATVEPLIEEFAETVANAGEGTGVELGPLSTPSTDKAASTQAVVDALAEKADLDITVTPLTASRATTSTDNGAFLENATANDYTITVEASTVPNGLLASQRADGKVVLVAGAGVTFIGSVLSTVNAGDFISLTKTATANTFIVSISLQAQSPNPFTSRALTNADNDKTLVPSNASQTVTINTGLMVGFSAYVNNNATVTAGAGVTLTDKRTSGATNPTFAIVNTGANTYELIGSKT